MRLTLEWILTVLVMAPAAFFAVPGRWRPVASSRVMGLS